MAAIFTHPPPEGPIPDCLSPTELMERKLLTEHGHQLYKHLCFTGLGGVWIVSPAGVQLKFISLPNAPLNIAFGGPNGRTLYMTCKNKVYSLAMCVRGGESTEW